MDHVSALLLPAREILAGPGSWAIQMPVLSAMVLEANGIWTAQTQEKLTLHM